jgi:hypothetical protein
MMTQLNWKEQVAASVIKQGPWAILATALLCFFGYELHQLQAGAGAAISEYVQQSSENISALRDSTELQTKVLQQTQLVVSGNAQMLTQLIVLMSEAKTMMEPVAAERGKQTVILMEIRDSLK